MSARDEQTLSERMFLGERDYHFTHEDDMGVALVLAVFAAIIAAAFACGWYCGAGGV